jgi:hypothetical protein
MKIIALEIESPTATPAHFEPHLRAEARHVWDLQQRGIVREAYFRADRHTAVLVLECEDLAQARELTAEFPLVRQGLIHFDLIPLQPYSGLSRLFG